MNGMINIKRETECLLKFYSARKYEEKPVSPHKRLQLQFKIMNVLNIKTRIICTSTEWN